jgi:hypothetical protein
MGLNFLDVPHSHGVRHVAALARVGARALSRPCAPRVLCCAGNGRTPMLLWAIVGVVLIGMVLLDAFETIVLPQRVACRLRLARLVLLARA